MLDLDAKLKTQVKPDAPVIPVLGTIISQVISNKVLAIIAQVAIAALLGYFIYKTTPKPAENKPVWSGTSSTTGVGEPVPIIYGTRRTGGHIVQSHIFKAGDILSSYLGGISGGATEGPQWLRVLYAVSEGWVKDIRSIKINDVPFDNYNPTKVDGEYPPDKMIMAFSNTRTGTHSQGAMSDWFGCVRNSQAVGFTVADGNEYTYTTVASDLTDFIVTITFPQGLAFTSMDVLTPGLKSNNVAFRVKYRQVGSSTWSADTYVRYSECKQSKIVRTLQASVNLGAAQLNPAGAQYEVNIYRLTRQEFADHYASGDLDKYQYSSGNQSQATTIIDYVDEINTNLHPSYADTALLGVSLRATNVLSGGMPDITCIVDGIQVQKRVNGVWQEKDLCSNPAWIVYDLMTNKRYGLGAYIKQSDIDLDSFEAFASYCDEQVPIYEVDGVTVDHYDKRHTCNILLNSRQAAWDTIHTILAEARGIMVESDGKYRITIEQPTSLSQVFTMGNIVKNSFQSHWTSLKEDYNVVEAKYADAEADFKVRTVRYTTNTTDHSQPPDDEDAKTLHIEFVGITSYAEAKREAAYRLNLIRKLSQSVEFDAALDAIACQVGDVIGVAHDVPQWGYSGRVNTLSSLTPSVAKLDRGDLPFNVGTDYELCLRYPNDTVEFYEVTGVSGDAVTVLAATPLSPNLNLNPTFADGLANWNAYGVPVTREVVTFDGVPCLHIVGSLSTGVTQAITLATGTSYTQTAQIWIVSGEAAVTHSGADYGDWLQSATGQWLTFNNTIDTNANRTNDFRIITGVGQAEFYVKLTSLTAPCPYAPEDIIYSYGEVTKSVKPFRVLSITLNEDLTRHISASEYDEDVYEEAQTVTGEVVYDEDTTSGWITAPPASLANVTDIAVVESQVMVPGNSVGVVQNAFWSPPASAYMAGHVYVRPVNTLKWIYMGNGYDRLVFTVDGGDWEAAVCTENTLGMVEDPDNVVHTDFTSTAATASTISTYWSATEPASPNEGDLWFDTANGNHQYRYTSGDWADAQDSAIADAVAAATEAVTAAEGKITTYLGVSEPTATLVAGDLWIETDNNNKMWRWSGTGWVDATKTLANDEVKNEHVESLSASKLTAGTIDASVINVTNLNASNISTGTLSADKISGGTINGTNVTVTNLNASNLSAGTLNVARLGTGAIAAVKLALGTWITRENIPSLFTYRDDTDKSSAGAYVLAYTLPPSPYTTVSTEIKARCKFQANSTTNNYGIVTIVVNDDEMDPAAVEYVYGATTTTGDLIFDVPASTAVTIKCYITGPITMSWFEIYRQNTATNVAV